MGSIFTFKEFQAVITTQNLNPNSGTATPGSTIALDASSFGGMAIQVNGTYTGALSLQMSVDDTNWVTVGGNAVLNVNTNTFSATIPSAATGIWKADVTGAMKIRVTALAAVTGSATLNIALLQNSSIIYSSI